MKISINEAFWVPKNGEIEQRYILPAMGCNVEILSSLVNITHPGGNVSISSGKYKELIQKNCIVEIKE